MNRKIALIASVKEREETLKVVIDSIYDQVDEIQLVLNWYDEFPKWLVSKYKINAHLNPENKNAHDSIWQYLKDDEYYFILDDDLLYPADYIDKMKTAIDKYEKRAIVTLHGASILQPVECYLKSRATIHFSQELKMDVYVDMAGCNTVAFHSSTIKPTLQDFPIVFMRDLWLAILAKKNKVPIIAIVRPFHYTRALRTPGDTVWDATHNNKTLLRLKNEVLKEQFAPLLFCDTDIDKYCLITDYDFDERLLVKTLETLKCNSDCNKIVFSNQVAKYGPDVLTQYVIPEEVAIGRMGSKILTQYRFIKSLKDGSKVISADADLYFLKDPFEAFEQDFDLAITTRPFKHHYVTNYGVVMFRVNDRVRSFLDFLISEMFKRTWPELIRYQKHFNHIGNDWCVGQDMMSVAWLCREEIQKQFDIKIVDIGPKYNYCPHADGASSVVEQGKQQLMEAYKAKEVSVLHLKSRLRELLFDGLLK